MKKCRRNTIIISGFLLVLALLFIPQQDEVTGRVTWVLFDYAISEIDGAFLIAELVFIILFGGFIYLLFCVIPKMFRIDILVVENVPLVIGWILMIASVLILHATIMPRLKIGNVIFAAFAVTLVSLTLFYTIQIQRLIKQNKIRLRKRMRKIDPDIKNLIDFHLPLVSKFCQLELLIKSEYLSLDSIVALAGDIMKLTSENENILTDEAKRALIDLLELLQKVGDLREEEFERWKIDTLEGINKVRKLSDSEITAVRAKVDSSI